MSQSIYFTKPDDTLIAAKNRAFIEALQQTTEGMKGFHVVNRPDVADIVLIDERYQYRTWHYADELAKCVFVQQHAERICVINHDSYARPFLPGLYVSLEKSRPSFVSTRSIPYKWDLWKVPVPQKLEFQPTSLYTFRGTFHTHPVRRQMCKALSENRQGDCEELRIAFHSHDENDQLRYIKEIRDARFSLCPRGLSPSSYRLYESMQLGCCPVVISDDWVAPHGPDWEEFAIFIAESEIKHLPEILLSKVDEGEARGRLAREVWEEFFSWPRRWQYFLEQVEILQEDKADSLEFDELYGLWKSRPFRQRYQWTLTDRVNQWVVRKYRSLVEQPVP